MYISQKYFWGIFLLFMLIPFSTQWRLFVFGTKTTGTVIEQLTQNSPNIHNVLQGSTFCQIEYTANNKNYRFNAPEDVKYDIGETVTIIYDPENPEKHLLFSFAGLVFSPRMTIPSALLLIWIAFYLTMRQQYKLKEKKKTSSVHFNRVQKQQRLK